MFGIGFAFLTGTWLSGEQKALSEQLLRLHILAVSDSEKDQAVKLQVRDAILEQAEPWLEGVETREEAVRILSEHLPELARTGAETAGVEVTASVETDVWFPTREYEDFALPAGKYTALRIVLGEGKGRNWWCVVFPPLCMSGVSEMVAEQAGSFTDEQVRLISGEQEEYVIKFKAMELWNEFREHLEKK